MPLFSHNASSAQQYNQQATSQYGQAISGFNRGATIGAGGGVTIGPITAAKLTNVGNVNKGSGAGNITKGGKSGSKAHGGANSLGVETHNDPVNPTPGQPTTGRSGGHGLSSFVDASVNTNVTSLTDAPDAIAALEHVTTESIDAAHAVSLGILANNQSQNQNGQTQQTSSQGAVQSVVLPTWLKLTLVAGTIGTLILIFKH